MPAVAARCSLLLATLTLGGCAESYEAVRAIVVTPGEDCPTLSQARRELVGVIECDECCRTTRILRVLAFEDRVPIQTTKGPADQCRYRVRERPAAEQLCGLLCACI